MAGWCGVKDGLLWNRFVNIKAVSTVLELGEILYKSKLLIRDQNSLVTCFLIAQNLPDLRTNSERLKARFEKHQETCHDSYLMKGEKLNLTDSNLA